ncbi:MAG: 5-formyltetrahydrofolate cyclo-ligase [Clostridia bacterium]|nr:5-formyltetrahydrofolate cyclo-ligase [Clostridia bacterium]
MKQSEIAAKKASLRSALRATRRSLEPSRVEAASRAVCNKLIGLDEFKRAELMLAYMPSKNELDVSYAVKEALELGKRIAFPLCIEGGGLKLLVPNDETAFTVGSYGILEPDPSRSAEVFAEELDLIIVPAVAFSSACQRLGQGGGYYDRLLKRARCFTIGVGYDFQLIDDLPVEKHDIALDAVLLPSFEFAHSRLK